MAGKNDISKYVHEVNDENAWNSVIEESEEKLISKYFTFLITSICTYNITFIQSWIVIKAGAEDARRLCLLFRGCF